MRYLWVEDFDEGQNEERFKKEWKNYFGLSEKTEEELIIKRNLNEALEYIEANPEGFDAVLLDIRFPLGNESTVYKSYLEKFITEEFYEANKETGAGMLLFLYLIMKARFPADNIAFLSANIDIVKKDDDIPEDIKEALGYLDKYSKDSENVAASDGYEAMVDSLNESYGQFIKWEYIEDIENLDRYLAEIKKKIQSNENLVKSTDMSNEEQSVKYNKAKKEFEEVGIKISKAFSKPDPDLSDSNEDLDKEFCAWMNEIETDYCRLRRCIIAMCDIISKSLNEDVIVFGKKFVKSNDTDFNESHFKDLLNSLKRIPIIPRDELEENFMYRRLLSQISHDWESARVAPYYYPSEKEKGICNNKKGCFRKKYGYKLKENDKFICSNSDDAFKCEQIVNENNLKVCRERQLCNFAKNYKERTGFGVHVCHDSAECEYKVEVGEFQAGIAYNSVMKTVRNWVAHSKLKTIDPYSTAFIFGIGMRSFFDIDELEEVERKKYLGWEERLISIIESWKCDDKTINDSENSTAEVSEEMIEEKIKKSCANFYSTASKLDKFAYTQNMSNLVHNIGAEESSLDCKIEYILRLFGHCLFPIRIKPDNLNDSSEDSKYTFKLEVNTSFLKEGSIELKYFKAVFNRSFENL